MLISEIISVNLAKSQPKLKQRVPSTPIPSQAKREPMISSFSHSMQLSSCAAQSSKINRDLPVWVDKVTMFLSTRCEQKGDKVVMHYGMKVMMNRQQIPKAAMERIKLNVKNEACSRPDSKAFLRTGQCPVLP